MEFIYLAIYLTHATDCIVKSALAVEAVCAFFCRSNTIRNFSGRSNSVSNFLAVKRSSGQTRKFLDVKPVALDQVRHLNSWRSKAALDRVRHSGGVGPRKSRTAVTTGPNGAPRTQSLAIGPGCELRHSTLHGAGVGRKKTALEGEKLPHSVWIRGAHSVGPARGRLGGTTHRVGIAHAGNAQCKSTGVGTTVREPRGQQARRRRGAPSARSWPHMARGMRAWIHVRNWEMLLGHAQLCDAGGDGVSPRPRHTLASRFAAYSASFSSRAVSAASMPS
jgi:hypothetical protein